MVMSLYQVERGAQIYSGPSTETDCKSSTRSEVPVPDWDLSSYPPEKTPESQFDFFGSYKMERNPRIQISHASGRDWGSSDAKSSAGSSKLELHNGGWPLRYWFLGDILRWREVGDCGGSSWARAREVYLNTYTGI